MNQSINNLHCEHNMEKFLMRGAQLPRKRKSVDQRTKHRQICFQSKFITRQRQENMMTHILFSASPVQRWVTRRDVWGTTGGPSRESLGNTGLIGGSKIVRRRDCKCECAWLLVYMWSCDGLQTCPGWSPAFHLKTAGIDSSRSP